MQNATLTLDCFDKSFDKFSLAVTHYTLGGIASICFRFHFQQTLRIQIQGSQGCQKIREIVRNPKLPIAIFFGIWHFFDIQFENTSNLIFPSFKVLSKSFFHKNFKTGLTFWYMYVIFQFSKFSPKLSTYRWDTL